MAVDQSELTSDSPRLSMDPLHATALILSPPAHDLNCHVIRELSREVCHGYSDDILVIQRVAKPFSSCKIKSKAACVSDRQTLPTQIVT